MFTIIVIIIFTPSLNKVVYGHIIMITLMSDFDDLSLFENAKNNMNSTLYSFSNIKDNII